MHPARSLPFTLALLALVAGLARAQGPADRLMGRRVSEVRLLVGGRPAADAEFGRVVETQVGTVLSPVRVRESIVHLMALNRFRDVQVRADEDGDGVRVTFDLVPRYTARRVDFRGDLGLSEGQLKAEVSNRYGASPAAERGAEIARTLEAFYRDHGFLGASVTSRLDVPETGTEATLVFEVSAGRQPRVGGVDVQGVGSPASTVRDRLGLHLGAAFDPAVVSERAGAYVDDLRAEGYFEARVEVEPAYSPDGARADVIVRQERGPRVTLVFRGDALPETRRDERAAIQREGRIDEDMLENEQRSLEDDLRAEGFRDARVAYTREAHGPEDVRIVFTVTRGPQYRVARVETTGNSHLPRAVLQPFLRLAPGQWFVSSRLDADVATIAERYRREGFRDVKVQARVTAVAGAAAALDVVLAVTEGPRTRIESLEFAGNTTIDGVALRRVVQSRPGGPYYEPTVQSDRDAIVLAYTDRGYQLITVDQETTFTADRTGVALAFRIAEGPQIRVDHVLVVGNQRTKAATIERELGVKQGMPLSPRLLAEGQGRLNALGLFRRVRVTELQHGSDAVRDVVVMVEEAPPNTIGYGGGLEVIERPRTDAVTGRPVDKIDFSPRGFVEYGRRNLWGKNRSVNVFARAAIRTSDAINTDRADLTLDDEGAGFREYRLLGTYREPRLFASVFDLSLTAVTEQAIRPSFDFNRRQVSVDLSRRLDRTVTIAGRYSIGRTRLFNERIAEEDAIFVRRIFGEGTRLSSFSTSLTRNTRDDPADPTQGSLLFFDGTLAARRIGSEVGFVRGTAQGFTYRSLPALPGAVLALGVRVGFAAGFPRLVPSVDDSGTPILGPDGQAVLEENRELPLSERFFAGGETTVRGFGRDRLGAPGVLDVNGISKGGNSLIVLNSELRFPLISRIGLGGAAFVDVGNVYRRVTEIDLGQLRTGFGFGIRWRSPVGPLRVDLGWKATQHRYGNGTLEPRFAYHISIGQAF